MPLLLWSRFSSVLVFSLFLSVTAFTHGFAQADNAGISVVTAPEVKVLLEKGTVHLIHVLSEIEYDIQHIKGSINIPIIKIGTSAQLPDDKNSHIIFYCMGER